MNPALARLFRRFAASTRGLAAIEFAMVMPMLLLLFLASIDGARAIAIYMKVRSATYTLDSIINQYSTMQDTDMQSVLGATSVILAPYSSSPVVVVVSQLSITKAKATTATVTWSATQNGTALGTGSSVTVPALLTNGFKCNPAKPCYFIYGQVSYTYTPMFLSFTKTAMTLSDNLYVTPRSSPCVQYDGNPAAC